MITSGWSIRQFIQGRWTKSDVPPEIARQAEDTIAKDPELAREYEQKFGITL